MARRGSRQQEHSSPAKQSAEPRRSQRRERRCPLAITLKIFGFDHSGRIFSERTTTRNISRSGCCFRLLTRPLQDTGLALQVVPRDQPVPEFAPHHMYQVAWVRSLESAWEVGLYALGHTDLLQVAFTSHSP